MRVRRGTIEYRTGPIRACHPLAEDQGLQLSGCGLLSERRAAEGRNESLGRLGWGRSVGQRCQKGSPLSIRRGFERRGVDDLPWRSDLRIERLRCA